MKPVVALDLDDLIYPFMNALVPFHNDQYGTSLTIDDYHSFSFEEVWGGSREEAVAKVGKFFDEIDVHPGPMEESAPAIDYLAKHYSLAVVTSRTDEMQRATIEWVEKHFPSRFFAVYLCNSYMLDGRATKRSKATVCAEIGAVALVDDSLKNVADVASDGRTGILFGDYPWNRADHLPPGVTRARDWNEVLTTLDGMKS